MFSKFIFALLCFAPIGTFGYSGGAPASDQVCETMLPKHGQVPMKETPPFTSTLTSGNQIVSGGDKVTFNLEAPLMDDHFKGFLAMVKSPENPTKTYGTWRVTSGEEMKTIGCFGVSDSAITHTTSEEKTNVTIEWTAPNEDLEGVQLFVTWVRNWNETWIAVPHPQKLTVKSKSTPTARDGKMSEELRKKLHLAYGECEKGGCLGMPKGCVENFLESPDDAESDPEPCSVLLTWKVLKDVNAENNTEFEYTLTGPLNNGEGYLAMAFSEDVIMGNDSVVGCYVAGGVTAVQRFANIGYSNSKLEKAPQGIGKKGAELIDNHLICTFTQMDHNLEDVINVELNKGSYYYHLARGDSANNDGLGYHDLKETSGGKITPYTTVEQD